MDRLIYTALSGASQTLYEQQISANNLANVNTNGFRADMAMATNDKVKGCLLYTSPSPRDRG